MGMQHKLKLSSLRRGFTLIELSVVLLIISLMLGGILTIQNQKIRAERLAETNMKLDAISKALYNYRLIHGALPCPGDSSLASTHANFGLQANGASCDSGGTINSNHNSDAPYDTFGGSVPVTTLGLPSDYAVDAWGAYFTYYLHKGASNASNFATGTSAVDVSANAIIVKDESGTTISTNNIFAIVLSHGPNGHGAYLPSGSGVPKNSGSSNTNEENNCMCDNTANADLQPNFTIIVQQRTRDDYTDASTQFDDIVRFMPKDFYYTPSEIKASQ